MLVPLVFAVGLVVFMLPLWFLDNLGVPGLGHELNGFFVPSALGWGLAAGTAWLFFFWIFLGRSQWKARRVQ